MTQDEIMELARQAEIIHPEMVAKHLEAFAKLVAAKERERLADIAQKNGNDILAMQLRGEV